MRSISRSCPISDSKTSTPPTAMFTGPCSAASEERSAGERSCAICPRPYPGRKMAAVVSSRVMLRSCALALFAFAFLAWPAVAADTGVTFHYYAYSPSNARIAVHDTLTFTPDAGNDFENTPGAAHHPLHFDDNTIGDQTTGSA